MDTIPLNLLTVSSFADCRKHSAGVAQPNPQLATICTSFTLPASPAKLSGSALLGGVEAHTLGSKQVESRVPWPIRFVFVPVDSPEDLIVETYWKYPWNSTLA